MQPQSNRLLIVVGATVIAWIFRVSWAGLACLSNPCLNGICIDEINSSFICFCADGFTGELCGTNWDECWSSPCENGGSCTDSIAAFNCSCPPGFSGERCEWNVDECASNPCLNGGSCIDQENGFICSCPPGYAGHFCGIDVSVCNISYPMPHIPGPRCFNGGICLDGPGPNFTCVCADGWTGSRCEVQTDECISAPCKNGGLCIDLLADFSCACPFGYTGKTCEMTLQMCRGINGTRINIFGGVTEESLLEEDEEDVCENGALCLIESDGEKVCYCVPDYHGDRCQFRYDECLLAESSSWLGGNGTEAGSGGHCQNGGECIDGVDSFTCSCPANFTGRFCECPVYSLPETDVPLDCLNITTEFIPSTTSSSSSPPFFTAKTPTTASIFSETTTLPGLKTTQEIVYNTSVETSPTTLAFTSTTEEMQSTVTEGESQATGATKVVTEMDDFTTSASVPTTYTSTISTTSYTVFPTGEGFTLDTETTEKSTKTVTESSTQIMSTLRDVIGEDKKWFTEGVTPPVIETTSMTITYPDAELTTPTTSTLSALSTETVTEEFHSDRTTFSMVDATRGVDELSTTSSKTDQATFPSTLSTFSEMTTVRTTTDFIPHSELLSTTTAPVTEVEDAFASTEDVEVTQTTDLLVTYLYTGEKTTFIPSESLTEEITFSSISPEKSEGPEYFTSTKSQIDEGIRKSEVPEYFTSTKSQIDEGIRKSEVPEYFTSTKSQIDEGIRKSEVPEYFTSTKSQIDEGITSSEGFTSTPFTTGESLYSEYTTNYTGMPEEITSSTSTEAHSTPIIDIHVTPKEQSERPEHTTATQVVQSSETFTTTHTTMFTPIVTEESEGKTEFPFSEEQSTTTGDIYTTEIWGKTEAVTEVTPKISRETTSYKPSDLSTPTTLSITATVGTFTEVTTLGLSGEGDHTVPITTEPTEESVSTELGCNITPCLNGGTCYYNECECTFKFTGTFCEKKKYIEVASFNGHSYLMHSLNISEYHDQASHAETVGLEDSKINFKRHSDINSTSNKSHEEKSETIEIEKEYSDMFEETYDFYEEHSYDFSSYDYYDADEPMEPKQEKDSDHKDPPLLTTEKVNVSSHNSTILYDSHIHSQDVSPTILSPFNISKTASPTSLNFSKGESKEKSFSHTTTESVSNASSLNLTTDDILNKPSNSSTSSNGKKERGGRSLRSLPPISTTISVKINLQERSLRVGGWGLVMKVTLGNMAKASLTINHSTGLLRFHFTCGLGRSLLFGEEDGQRWASLSRQQPIQSMVIPVLVALEVFRYEAVHKNNPSGGRSYLQCAASLKINGQVAVKGQQRAPMPKKSSSRRDSSQFYLYLGGIPEILLPCNHAIEDSMSNQNGNYEQKDHYEEEEGFVGCMQDLKINGIPRQIFDDALDGNSITECGDKLLTGKESDIDENPCFSFPCFGSSTCEPTGDGSWRCRCPTGWHGTSCEHSVCENNPCLFGATCLQDDAGGFVCLCPLGRGGRFCENDLEITKPCFDSGNGWDVEEHQPYLAYPLDHNHLSSPQLVFRFKFSPASINQIGLLAYIGDLKLPKSFHALHPSFLSELKDSYLETTTFPTTLESSQRVDYPTHSPKDLVSDLSQSTSSKILHDADVVSSTESVELENGSPSEDTLKAQDFLPPLDIPLFQDEGPSYLQNFSSSESFSSYSNYLFSPFSPYPYYVRQNGRDHMAVSYIRGHLVLTWDLGSGPRRIFTSKPIPKLNEASVEITDDALLNAKDGYHQPLSMQSGTVSSSLISDTEMQSATDTNASNSAKNPNDARSSAYVVGSDKMLSSRNLKKILSVPEVNSSKENYPSKIPEESSGHSNHSQILESGLNISYIQGYSLNSKDSVNLNSTFSNQNVSSAPEEIKEQQSQAVDSTRIKSIRMKGNDSESEKTTSPHSDSNPSPPYASSISPELKQIPSPEHYYEVTVWREGQQAWLKVGDQVVRGQSPGRHYQLNAHRPFLYLGGHDAVNVSSLPHDIPLHSSFSGCIFDASLRFGGGHTVMGRRVPTFTKGRGVGECGSDPCKIASKGQDSNNPCLNGGKCVPHGPTFICICKKSWFGPLCADSGHNPCDEGVHACKHGSTCVSQPLGGYKCDCLPGTYGLYCEKELPIGWSVKLSGQRSFLGVRIPFRGWRKRPASISSSERSKKEAFCIDLEIKPNRPNSGGIVLYIMGSHQDEFLALSINSKGEPELRIGPGSSRMVGPLVIGFNGKFQKENTNQEDEKASLRVEGNEELSQLSVWRKIRIFRRGLRVFLAMDGLLHGAGTLNEPSQILPSIRPYNNSVGSSLPLLYLGGLPDLAMLPQNAVGDVKMARPFAGCIRNVAVNWQKVPLGEGSGSYGRNAFSC